MADKEILNSGGFSAMLKELFTKIKSLLSEKLDTTANAVSATKLNTAKTIGISGGATGTATSFDGSTNITIPVTSLDATKLSGTASISTTGNSGSATKLATARTIALSGGATGTATSFNGSANISIPVTTLDATKLTGTASINTTGNAGTATKAIQDANGNVITASYGSILSLNGSSVLLKSKSGATLSSVIVPTGIIVWTDV